MAMELIGGVRLQRPRLALPSQRPARPNSVVRCSLASSERTRLATEVRRSIVRSTVCMRAATGNADGVKWWEKDGGPNFQDLHSTQEFVDALANVGEKLVVVEFYVSWCGLCRALYPKLCKTTAEHLALEFMNVNFKENKPIAAAFTVPLLLVSLFRWTKRWLLTAIFFCSAQSQFYEARWRQYK